MIDKNTILTFPKWPIPSRVYISAGSSCGKTTFVERVLDEQDHVFDLPNGEPFTRIILAHSAPDPKFQSMAAKHEQLELHEGLPVEFLKRPEESMSDGDHVLVILDDLQYDLGRSLDTMRLWTIN